MGGFCELAPILGKERGSLGVRETELWDLAHLFEVGFWVIATGMASTTEHSSHGGLVLVLARGKEEEVQGVGSEDIWVPELAHLQAGFGGEAAGKEIDGGGGGVQFCVRRRGRWHGTCDCLG